VDTSRIANNAAISWLAGKGSTLMSCPFFFAGRYPPAGPNGIRRRGPHLHIEHKTLIRFCRVAGRGYPRPAPSEPCMGFSIHTAQASAKASRDTRFHNGIFGRLMIFTAIEMVYLKITRCIRSTFGSFHDTTNTPRDARRDGFLTIRTQAVLPEPDAVQLRTAF
jgi:hypothetical protein